MSHQLLARLGRNIAPFALLVGLASTGLAGCGAQGPDTETAPAAKEAVNTQTPQDSKGHLRGHGPEMIFRTALSELDLTADQRTKINGLIDDMKPSGDEPHHALPSNAPPTEVFSALAAQVRTGKIDQTAIQSKIDAIKAEPNGGFAKMATSLQTLHDTLTSDQRAKLVASIKSQMADHEAQIAEKHEAHEGRGDRAGKHGHGAPFMHGLDLTDEQKTQIDQALANAGIEKPEGKERFAEMKAHATAVLDAFPADKFDATTVMPKAGEGPGSHLSKMVKAMSVVVPILTDAQRATLADNLEKGPAAHMRGGKNHETENESL